MTGIAALGSTQHGTCVPGWSLDGNTAGLWAHCGDGNKIADLFARLRPSLTTAVPQERVLAAEVPPTPTYVAPIPTFGPQHANASRGSDIAMFSEDGSPLTDTGAPQARSEGMETETANSSPSGFGGDNPAPPPSDAGPLLQCSGCLTSRSTNPPGPPSGPGTSGGSGNPGEPSGPVGPSGPIIPPVTPPVSGIPEPSEWTLLIFGFGLVGATVRRGSSTARTLRVVPDPRQQCLSY